MDIQKIVENLESVYSFNKHLTQVEKEALERAIGLLRKSNTKEQLIKAVEILVKLLGISSNLFDK